MTELRPGTTPLRDGIALALCGILTGGIVLLDTLLPHPYADWLDLGWLVLLLMVITALLFSAAATVLVRWGLGRLTSGRWPGPQAPRESRLRRAAVLTICAIFTGGLAGYAQADPFHLRYTGRMFSGLVLISLVLLTAAAAVRVRRGGLRVLALVLGGAMVFGFALLAAFAASLQPNTNEIAMKAEGHGMRLHIVEGAMFSFDPIYAVVVRSGSGAFEQESLVYQGLEEGDPPDDARFLDARTIELTMPSGCRYRSTVDPDTLTVTPVHRAGHLDDAC